MEKLERIIELKSSQQPLEQEKEEELTQLQQELKQSLEESNEIYQNKNYNNTIEECNNETAEELLKNIKYEKRSLEDPIQNISGTLESSNKDTLIKLKILQEERKIFLEKYEQLSQEEKEKLISPEDLEIIESESDLYNKIIELKDSNEPVTPEKEAEIIEKQREYYMNKTELNKIKEEKELQSQKDLKTQEKPVQEQQQTNTLSNEEIYNNFQKMTIQSMMMLLSSIPGVDYIIRAFSANKSFDELLKYGKEHQDEIKAYLEERKNSKEQQKQEGVQLTSEDKMASEEQILSEQTEGQQLEMPQNNIAAFQQPEFGIEQPPKSNEEIYKEYNQLLGKSVLNIVDNIPIVRNYVRMNIGMNQLNETAKYAKEHNEELKAYMNEMKQKEQQKQSEEQQKQQTQNLTQAVEKQNKEDGVELS